MPCRCKSWPNRSPEGPAPMMATWVFTRRLRFMDGTDSRSKSCNSDMLSRKRPAWNGFFSLKLVLFEEFLAIWYDDKSSLESEHEMSLSTDIPVYKLYGEHDQWLTPDMVHCESIAARSQLHNWQIKPHQHHGLFQILYLKK